MINIIVYSRSTHDRVSTTDGSNVINGSATSALHLLPSLSRNPLEFTTPTFQSLRFERQNGGTIAVVRCVRTLYVFVRDAFVRELYADFRLRPFQYTSSGFSNSCGICRGINIHLALSRRCLSVRRILRSVTDVQSSTSPAPATQRPCCQLTSTNRSS